MPDKIAAILVFFALLFTAAPTPAQAKYNIFGSGCAGSTSPNTRPVLSNTGLPALGKSFSLDLRGGRAQAPCILFIGASNTFWNGNTLPWELTPLGARGCWLRISLDLGFKATTDAAGSASLKFAVPNVPFLTGLKFYNQYVVDDAAANGFGLVLSNGGAGTLGLPTASIPTVVADVTDGTCRDIAASTSRMWLAQGRTLAVFDARNYRRIPAEEVTYGTQLVAVEYNQADNLLYVASATQVDTFYLGTGKRITWLLPTGEAKLNDIKFFPGTTKVVALSGNKLRVLSHTTTTTTELGQAKIPSTLIGGTRLAVAKLTSGKYAAYVIGMLAGSTVRDVNGFVTFDLNPAGKWQPVAHQVFNPTTRHGARATAQYLQVISDRAYLACGMQKVNNIFYALLLELDVAKPNLVPAILRAAHLKHPYSAWNVQKDAAQKTLWIACSNRLFRLNLPSLTSIGSTLIGFYDAGERDMAYVEHKGRGGELWTATHHSSDYCLHHISVDDYTVPGYLPKTLQRRWWLSSSDGAVAVPEFKSVYLPTFGGLARYDISNVNKPVAAADSGKKAAYQPSGSNTEHVAYLRLNATSGYVVTVRGDGGFEAYAVDSAEPNPAPPLSYKNPPSAKVYANGIETWSHGGSHYVLIDVTDRSTSPNTFYLQAWQYTGAGSFKLTAQAKHSQAAIGSGLCHNVCTFGTHAFVGGEALFMVVDLQNLPTSMVVTDVVRIPNQDGVRGIAASQSHVFVGLDGNANGGAIESYTFDAKTGDVGGTSNAPLDRLTRADIPNLQVDSRVRHNPVSSRIYACGKGGQLHEVDVSDPRNLVYLSTYDSPFEGESQDCRIYAINGKTLVLYVKNNEAFALLDPDDGL